MAEGTKLWICKMQSGELKLFLQMQKWTGRTFLPGIGKNRGAPRWGTRQGHSLAGHSAVPQGISRAGRNRGWWNPLPTVKTSNYPWDSESIQKRRWDQRSVTAFYFKLNSWFMEEGRLLEPNNVTIRCGSNLSVWNRRRENTVGKVIFSGWGSFFARGLRWPLEFP